MQTLETGSQASLTPALVTQPRAPRQPPALTEMGSLAVGCEVTVASMSPRAGLRQVHSVTGQSAQQQPIRRRKVHLGQARVAARPFYPPLWSHEGGSVAP